MKPTLRAQVYSFYGRSWSFEIARVDGTGYGFGSFYPTWREAYDAACAELRKRAES